MCVCVYVCVYVCVCIMVLLCSGGDLVPHRHRSHSAGWIDQTADGDMQQHSYQESAYAYCRTGRVQSVPKGLNHPSFTTTEQFNGMSKPHANRSAARRAFNTSSLKSRTSSGPNLSIIAGEYKPKGTTSAHWKRNGVSLQTSPVMRKKFAVANDSMGKRQSSLPLLEMGQDAMLDKAIPGSGSSTIESNGDDIRQRMMELGTPQSLDESNSSAKLQLMRPRVGGGRDALNGTRPNSSQDKWDSDVILPMARNVRLRDTDDSDLAAYLASLRTRSGLHSPTSQKPFPQYTYRDATPTDFSAHRTLSADDISQSRHTPATSPTQVDKGAGSNAPTPTSASAHLLPTTDSPSDQQQRQDEPFFIPQFRQFPSHLHSLKEEALPLPSELYLPFDQSLEARYLEASSYRSYASSGGRTIDTASTGLGSSADGHSTDAGNSGEEHMTELDSHGRKKKLTRKKLHEAAEGLGPYHIKSYNHSRVRMLRQEANSYGGPFSSAAAGRVGALGKLAGLPPLKFTDFSDSDAASTASTKYDVPQTPAVPYRKGRIGSSGNPHYDTPTEPALPASANGETPKRTQNVTFSVGTKQASTSARSDSTGDGAVGDEDESPLFLRLPHHRSQFSNASSATSSFHFTPGTCEVKLRP